MALLLRVFTLSLFWLWQSTASGEPKGRSLCEFPDYLVDVQGTLTFSQLPREGWSKSSMQNASFGWNSDVFWVRCPYQKMSDEPKILELGYPLLDNVHIYVEQEGRMFAEFVVGDRVVNQGYVVDRVDPAIRLEGPAGLYQLTFRIESVSAKQLPLREYVPELFFAKEKSELLINGAYIGILSIMAVYNLFVFAATRHSSYLFYSLFVVSMMLFQQSANGFTAEYFWPSHKGISDFFINQGVVLSPLTAVMFSYGFLHWHTKGQRWQRFGQGLMSLNILVFCCSWILPHHVTMKCLSAAVSLTGLSLLGASFIQAFQGSREAKFYLLAWSAVLGACVVYILKQLGFLPINDFTLHAFKLGSMIEVCLLSLALADRLNTLKDELKIELRIRHMLVGDLAHRVNNPLNQMMLGKENLANLLQQQEVIVKQILAGQDPEEASVQEVSHFFEAQHKDFREQLGLMKRGLDKSIHGIEEIRALSGVDGYSLEQVRFSVIVNRCWDFLGEHLPKAEVDRLQLETNIDENLWLFTHPTIAGMLLEIILRDWLTRSEGGILVSLRGDSLQDGTYELLFSTERIRQNSRANAAFIREQLTYLAKPYQIRVHHYPQGHKVSLVFPGSSIPRQKIA